MTKVTMLKKVMKMTQKDAEHAEQQNVQAVTLWAAADLETEGLERCIQFNVQIVIKNHKYHSYQEETSLSIVTSVFKIIKETRKYTSILDKINPIRTYYVATIVLVIATIVFFILDF